MDLASAITTPLGGKVLLALVSGNPAALSALAPDVVRAAMGAMVAGVDAQREQFRVMDSKLDRIIEQDFARDFDSAIAAMQDAVRSPTEEDARADLAEAWSRLRSAAAGTTDILLRAEALLAAAVVAVQRQRPADALDRAQAAWDLALESISADYPSFSRGLPVTAGSVMRTLLRDGPEPPSHRIPFVQRCIDACLIADRASLLLAGLNAPGHPLAFRPVATWNGMHSYPSALVTAGISLVASRAARLAGGAFLAYRDPGYSDADLPSLPVKRAADLGRSVVDLWVPAPKATSVIAAMGAARVPEQQIFGTGDYVDRSLPTANVSHVEVGDAEGETWVRVDIDSDRATRGLGLTVFLRADGAPVRNRAGRVLAPLEDSRARKR